MGKYHPHGDQAIYDALVRLAQDFAQRYPLVDGQGNFGNIDGDNAAAMRYTECRLTEAAQLLLDGIDEDAVDFRATYDGEERSRSCCRRLPEPAGQRLVRHRRRHGDLHPAAQRRRAVRRRCCTSSSTPTRASEAGRDDPGPGLPHRRRDRRAAHRILEAYETGRGGVRLRARWNKEETGRGTYQIVVTEIPYQVQKAG